MLAHPVVVAVSVAVAMHTMDIVITLLWPAAAVAAAAASVVLLPQSVPAVAAAVAAVAAPAARRIGSPTLVEEFMM